MAWSRLLLRPSLHLLILLSLVIWSINSEEDGGEEFPVPLALGHLTISGEPISGEGIDQDDIVEYRQPNPQTLYRPLLSFKRYQQQPLQVQPGANHRDSPPGASKVKQRRKKDCGFPVLSRVKYEYMSPFPPSNNMNISKSDLMVLARRLFGPVMKRSQHYFANSEEEVQEKMKEEDNKNLAEVDPHARSIRSTEMHSGGCMAKRQWIDMGSDFYPRYVKSYHCTSTACDKGFGHIGECKGKHYTTKVLKRITTADSTSVEDCDQSLPEDLRVAWKLVSVQVTTCCDCISPSRMFGLK